MKVDEWLLARSAARGQGQIRSCAPESGRADAPIPGGDSTPIARPPASTPAPRPSELHQRSGSMLVILVCQRRLKGATMQVEFDDISSGEGLLRQVREEEFVDDARTRDANGALLFACWMGCHHHAAGHTLGSHRHFWAVVEAAHHLAFWTLLELIWWEMQTRLDQRMIEHGVLLAAGHKGEAGQISEHGPGPILAVEPKQGACRRELVRREIPTDGCAVPLRSSSR